MATAGRPEDLDRAIEVEGVHSSGAPLTLENCHSSWRAPMAPQLSLYGLSLLFVVQKVVLCGSNLYVSCMCRVVLAGWLEPDRCLWRRGCWLAGLEQLGRGGQVHVVTHC